MSNSNQISEEVNNELRELSPTLASIHKTNPFSAPVGYFDNLSVSVQDKIQTSQKGGKLLHLVNWKLSLVAASVALLMATWMVFGPSSTTTPTYSLEEFTADDIQLFIENDTYYQLDEAMIVASLVESDDVWRKEEVIKKDEAIIDYLIEEDIDMELIISEYNNI